MNKKLIATIILLVVSVSLLVVFLQKNRWYSLADVARHSDSKSCWTIINGGVYDLTSLVATHTGGSKAILQVCGKDGSAIFKKMHGDDTDIMKEIEKYKIGTIGA